MFLSLQYLPLYMGYLITLNYQESSSDSKVIRDFKENVSTQLIERFELTSLHAAHPMLMGSLLDPQLLCLNTKRKVKLGNLSYLLRN